MPLWQVLSAGDYAEWVEQRREAEVAMEGREERLFHTACMVETQLELLGRRQEVWHVHVHVDM